MGELLHGNFGRSADLEMTKAQAAAYKHRSTRWIEMQMNAGLPFHRKGSRAMFWRSDLDEWGEREAANG